MKHIICGMLTLLFLSSALAQEDSLVSNQEPISSFTLMINDKSYTLSEGEELRLDTTLSNPLISIRQSKHRTFKNSFISFDYPSYMSYDFEEDFAFKCWSLDGIDFVIMVFAFSIEMDMDEFIDSMVDEFGRENCKVGKTQIELGDQLFKGKKIKATIISTEITMDILKIASPDGATRLLVIQDSKNDDGTDSKESKEVLQMLNRTMELWKGRS